MKRSEQVCEQRTEPSKDDQIATLKTYIATRDNQLREYVAMERVLVAAGIVTEEKLQQAKDIVRDFGVSGS